MLRQWVPPSQTLQRQRQSPVRFVSVIRMVISFNAHAVRGSTANDRSPPRRVSPRELDLWRTRDPNRTSLSNKSLVGGRCAGSTAPEVTYRASRRDGRRRVPFLCRPRCAPIAQLAEAADLKSAQCRFESDWGHGPTSVDAVRPTARAIQGWSSTRIRVIWAKATGR